MHLKHQASRHCCAARLHGTRCTAHLSAAAAPGRSQQPEPPPPVELTPLPEPVTPPLGVWRDDQTSETSETSDYLFSYQRQPGVLQHILDKYPDDLRRLKQQQPQRRERQAQRSYKRALGQHTSREDVAASRSLTKNLSSACSAGVLVNLLEQHLEVADLRHAALALRMLAKLEQKQHGDVSTARAQVGCAAKNWADDVAKLHSVTERLLKDKVAAEQAGSAYAVNGRGGRPFSVRALATAVYSWALLQHTPPLELLEQLLDAFIAALPPQCQQQPQQQQQDVRGAGDAVGSTSEHDVVQDAAAEQAACRSLSNMLWGLTRLRYNCKRVYNSPSTSKRQLIGRAADSSDTTDDDASPEMCSGDAVQLTRQQEMWTQMAAATLALAPTAASHRDLSSLAYAFGAAGYRDVVLWASLVPFITASLQEFEPHDLSQTLWAYVAVGAHHQPLFDAALQPALALLPGFKAQGMANLLWAYCSAAAAAGSSPPAVLVQGITSELTQRGGASEFNPLDLVLVASALARARTAPPPDLARMLCTSAQRQLHNFTPKQLSRLLSGLATVGATSTLLRRDALPLLLAALSAPGASANGLSHGCWAYAFAGDAESCSALLPPLIALAEQQLPSLLRDGNTSSRLLACLAVGRHRADALLDLIVAQLQPEEAAAGMQDATRAVPHAMLALWERHHLVQAGGALARLGCEQHAGLLTLLMSEFLHRTTPGWCVGSSAAAVVASAAQGASPSTLRYAVVLLWSAAVLAVQPSAPEVGALLALVRQLTGGAGRALQLSDTLLAQLAQVHMWLEASKGLSSSSSSSKEGSSSSRKEGSSGSSSSSSKGVSSTRGSLLPPHVLRAALKVWRQLVSDVTCSALQHDVFCALAALQLQPVGEHVTPDGMFSVDIMVQRAGRMVAVEVMGAEHYSSNAVLYPQHRRSSSKGHRNSGHRRSSAARAAGYELLGPERLRLRLLAARGYALVTVSSYEWATATAHSRQLAQQLLLAKLIPAVRAANAADSAATDRQRKRARAWQQQQLLRTRGTGTVQQQQHANSGAGIGSDTLMAHEPTSSTISWEPEAGATALLSRALQPAARALEPHSRRQRAHARRRELHKQGVSLLALAAAAGAGATRAPGSSGGSTSNLPSMSITEVTTDALYLSEDEFDMDLDLDELLPRVGSSG